MASAAGAPTLVGRDREIEALREALVAARAGHGRVVLVEGEAGIGKTRVIEMVCQLAHDDGFEVLQGGCDDLAPSPPFAALARALGAVPEAPDPDRAAVGALLEGHDEPDLASLPGGPAPGLQYRVVDGLTALVERLAARGPLLLALEDLQWADVSTLIALRSIARRGQTLPLVLLASCRAGHEVAGLHRVTDALLRDGGTRLALGPLDEAAVESLVVDVLGSDPSDALLERVRGASGNPLFVIEYVRSIDEGTVAEGRIGTAPEFRLTVVRRLATLPESTNHVLRLAAVLGSSFSPADLAAVSGRPVVELVPTLQRAVAGGVIVDRGEELAFRHALVRDGVYESIPSAVRRQLHREAGHALAEAGADALAVAHHLVLSAEGADPEAVAWLRRAARDAAIRSPAVAVELLEQAHGLLDPTSPDRDMLMAELAMAMAWSGRLTDAEALSTEVLNRRLEPAVTGSLRCGLVYALTWQGRAVEALQHAVVDPEEHLSEWDATLLRAEAAVASLFAFDLKAAASRAVEAAEQAERIGHDLAQCHALTVQSWVAVFAGDLRQATELARRAIDVADHSAGGVGHLAHPRFFPGIPLLTIDRLAEAEDTLRTGLRVAETLGLAWSFPLYHVYLGTKGFIAGEWDDAIAEFEAALAAADEVGLHVGVIAATSGWLAAIQLHRDDLKGADQTLSRASARLAKTGPQLGMNLLNWARALVMEARGETEQALGLLQRGWDLYMAGGPVTDSWSAMSLVRLCVTTGNSEQAAALLPVIDEQATATGTPFMRGQALRCRALVDQDPDALVQALVEYRESPRPLETAEACEDAAALLASAERLDEAIPLWDDAIELYERLGAKRDVARLRGRLREWGVKRGTRRRHVRATSGWESLTETEHKVVELVAQRMSNPEVAERLFISRHTVESHLKHIYRKLGLSSRVELASLAAQHAPVG